MTRIFCRVFFLFSAFTARSSHAAALTLDSIRQHYRNISEFHGEAEQTKTSPLLLRPLKSKVQLSLEKEVLTWQPEGQEPWRMRFSADGKPVFINGGKTLAQLPSSARDKLDRTVTLVRNILTMDPKLDDDFHLKLDQGHLTIEPKSVKVDVFFKAIDLTFKPNADLLSINFKTADDETTLLFKTMTITRL